MSTDQRHEHYFALFATIHPDGTHDFAVEPDVIVNPQAPIWDNELDDYITADEGPAGDDYFRYLDDLKRRLKSTTTINKIITAIRQDGEHFTDGECLDEVFRILEDAGYLTFGENS